jgi:hypothetical protein
MKRILIGNQKKYDMINWNKGVDPIVGRRLIVKLPTGQVCSGVVTESEGFEIEHVDNIMLLSSMMSGQDLEWIYAHSESKES